jgi:hypothetical protein
MKHLTNTAARLLLGLSVLPTALLLPAIAAADAAAPSTKAQIEHAERGATPAHTTKAQVEAVERAAAPAPATVPQSDHPTVPSSGSGDAAAWQLAVSAAFGAALAGGVIVASRQLTSHRHPVAS